MSLPFTFGSHAGATSSTVTAYSLSSNAVTLDCLRATVGAGSQAGVGTDGDGTYDSSGTHATAVYVTTFSLTDLTAGVAYPFSVTQNGVTRTGSLQTYKPATSDVKLAFIGCDSPMAKADPKGCWGHIRAQSPDCIVHSDDHGYPDKMLVPNFNGNLRWATIDQSNALYRKTYGWCVAYAAYLGLFEYIDGSDDPAGPTTNHTFWDAEDRIWCRENISKILAPGDHELLDNGESDTALSAIEIGKAKTAWTNFYAKGQGMINSANSAATHDVVGPVEIVCVDKAFCLPANPNVYSVAAGVMAVVNGVWLGTSQLNDIRGAINTTSPFKVVFLPTGTKYMMDHAALLTARATGWGAGTLGAAQPLHDYTLVGGNSEFLELFGSKANAGIFGKVSASYTPVIVILHGDVHRPSVSYHYIPGNANNYPIDLYEVSTGSVNGSTQQGLHTSLNQYSGYNGQNITYMPSWVSRSKTNDGTADVVNTYVLANADNDTGVWRLKLEIIKVISGEDTGEVLHTVTLYQGRSNNPDYLRKGFI